MTATSITEDGLVIRKATAADLSELIDVCKSALGWSDSDPNEAFFRWKHFENPFGDSPIWLATDADRIVGVRALMRWELHQAGRPPLSMLRAVDTATAPTHQGRGIFTKLTKAALEASKADGIDAVFNTPNDQSRPGYLKMKWKIVGRVPIVVRPRTPLALTTMLRSRTSAEKWGQPTSVGEDPSGLFDSSALTELEALTRSSTTWPIIHTETTQRYLRWRTGFGPLACRVMPLGDTLADGLIIFRLRQRGQLRQLSILETVLPPGQSERRVRSTISHLLRATKADVALATAASTGIAHGMVPLPRSGPVLTWRPLANLVLPAQSDLGLSLGSVELF